MTDPQTITLTNGAVVKVGDTVPMTDGTVREVTHIDMSDGPDVCVGIRHDHATLWHSIDGTCYAMRRRPAIDLAKLAEQQAALRPSPLSASAEAAQALVDAVRRSGEQFRLYEQMHMAKGNLDGDAKARTNSDFAAMCEAALAVSSSNALAVSAARHVDITNHHNATKCPYCTPSGSIFVSAEQAAEIAETWEMMMENAGPEDGRAGSNPNSYRSIDSDDLKRVEAALAAAGIGGK